METKTERKLRLRKAAGDAIERAIEIGGDPFDLMMAATGESANICVPYVQQHSFFLEKRRFFKTAEDRQRDRDQAALAAEAGPIVWVRRQFMCDGMIAGDLAHRCAHGPPPHRIKVCITKKGNEKIWGVIADVAPMQSKSDRLRKRGRRATGWI